MSQPEGGILSLLPSATEMLCALGLEQRLVGVSHECDYPPGVQRLPVVTASAIGKGLSSEDIDAQVREHLQNNAALYSVDGALLRELAPQLIVTQALCDVCAVSAADVTAAVGSLSTVAEVVNLEPSALQDVLDTIIAVGQAAGVTAVAHDLVAELEARRDAVAARTNTIAECERPRVVMLEWLAPPFNAGHWTPELVTLAGGRDCLGTAGEYSTTISWQAVREADPDVLVFACCGFDIPRTLEDLVLLRERGVLADIRAVQEGRLYVIDGNHYFNRPGPRLIDSLEVLAHLLHPEIHPIPAHLDDAFVIPA